MADVVFEKSQEVASIAQRLIGQCHSHLVEANILYLFRKGPWKVKRSVRLGNANKCTGKEKYLIDHDFIIMINWELWATLNLQQKEALVDHELLHCCQGEPDENGDPTWYVRDHTFSGFPEEVRRHGLWSTDLMLFKKAAEEHKQISIFDKDKPDLKVVTG